MIEYLSPIAAVYNILKNAIKDAMDHFELSQRKEIQRKIVSLQLILVNIIETADRIYERIDVIRANAHDSNRKVLEDIKALAFSQNHALYKLATELEDSTTEEILRLLSPNVRRDLNLNINSKRARIGLLMKVDDLTTKGIKNLYTTDHYEQGHKVLEKLRECADGVAVIIREKISLEELLSTREA